MTMILFQNHILRQILEIEIEIRIYVHVSIYIVFVEDKICVWFIWKIEGKTGSLKSENREQATKTDSQQLSSLQKWWNISSLEVVKYLH